MPTPLPINLSDKLTLFSDQWQPRVVAELNDYQIKLVKIEGEFVWHKHDDTDELFYIVAGELVIEFRDRSVALKSGDMIVVPRGVEHRPVAPSECHIMLIEPRDVVNTGDAGGELTALNDLWI